MDNQNDQEQPAPKGNGGMTDKYSWTQTLQEVSVSVALSADLKGRDLVVDFSENRLLVQVKGETPIIDGETDKEIEPSESLWTLSFDNSAKKKVLNIDLCKRNKMEWWSCVVKGDQGIDTKTIRPENSTITDLDAETQRTVRKMMHDNQQKMMGLPTSEDEKKNEMLQKFMAAHPEMDFSKAKMT